MYAIYWINKLGIIYTDMYSNSAVRWDSICPDKTGTHKLYSEDWIETQSKASGR